MNLLWFLSLAISLTSALLATLLQQWARRYLKVTQTHYSLHKRARIRAFFAEGVDKSFLRLAVDALPALVHVSLFLFFAGLVVFLWNLNFTIFKSVLAWVSISMAFYGCITFIPIYRHDSPYYSPLTALMRYVITAILIVFGLLYICFYTLIFCCTCCFGFGLLHFLTNIFDVPFTPLNKVLQLTMQTPEEATPKSPSAIDTRTFMWTLDRLDEDHELESFFLGMPGFHSSNLVKEPLRNLNDAENIRLLGAMIDFLDRTYSSDLLSDQVNRHRDDLCANAVDLVDTPKAFPGLFTMFTSKYKDVPAEAVEISHFVRRWGNRLGQDTIPVYIQAISTFVVAKAKQHNDSWFILASEELGVPVSVLRQHAAHGNSLSLAILIYVICQQFNHSRNPSWPKHQFSEFLEAGSKFDAQNTSPKLQHDFCALWNQVVAAQLEDNNLWFMTTGILRRIHNIYISLHQDTNSAATLLSAPNHALYISSTYPACNVAGHLHDYSAPTAFVPPDITEPPPASLASLPASSSSVPAPLHIDQSLTTVPPLDSCHRTETTIETVRLHGTTPDPTNADELQDIITTGTSMPYPVPEAPTSALHHSSTSPPVGVTLRHSTDTQMPFNAPNLPLSASTNPVLNNTVQIGLSHSSHLPITLSVLLLSFPESHHSMIVTASPSASPEPTSVPDLGAAAEGGGGAAPGLCKEGHALDPPSVNRTIDVTLDLLKQSSSLPSVTDPDVAIEGHSLREPNAEHDGADCPSHPSLHQYDMV